MKPVVLMVALAGALASSIAIAHAHLHASMPVNNSVVAEAPKKINLQFNEAVQLTAATIQKGNGPATKLRPLPAAVAKDFTLVAPLLVPGTYIVKWRAMSDDGHIMSDKLLFTVGPTH